MHTTDNHATFMCRLSGNLRASSSWDPRALSMPVHACPCLSMPVDGLQYFFEARFWLLLSPRYGGVAYEDYGGQSRDGHVASKYV
jgi:hypothetical protein